MAEGRGPLLTARQLVRQAAAGTSVNVWFALLALLTTPWVLRGLGEAAYGVFALVSVVSSYLLNLEFGFGYATVRFLARARAQGDRTAERAFANTSFGVFAAGGLVAGLVLWVSSSFLVHSFFTIPAETKAAALGAFRLAALGLCLSFGTTFFSAALQGLGCLGRLNAYRLVFGTLSPLVAIATLWAGFGLTAVVAGQVVVGLVQCLALASGVARVRGEWTQPLLRPTAFREMATFSALVFATGVTYQLMMSGPTLVLGARVSSAALPAFTVPGTVVQKLNALVGSASLGFFPFASAAAREDDRSGLAAVFRSHLRLTLLTLGPLVAFLVAFAQPLFTAWIGSDFALAASPCLRLLAASALVLAIGSPPADVARGLGHPSWVLTYTTGTALLGLGGSWLVTPWAGAPGAAWVFLLSALVGTLPLLFLVAHRLLGIPASDLLQSLGAPALAVLGLGALFLSVAHTFPGLAAALAAGGLGAGAYSVLAYTRLLEPRERGVLRRALGLD